VGSGRLACNTILGADVQLAIADLEPEATTPLQCLRLLYLR
jgi:hypothetical protein